MKSVNLPGHHSNYSTEMQGLFYHIFYGADTTYLPTYTTVDDMTQTIQNLQLSDLLEYDDDGSSTTTTVQMILTLHACYQAQPITTMLLAEPLTKSK